MPKPPEYRFRWNLIWIAIVILILLFLFNGMEPAFTFDELAYRIEIENMDRWRRFCTWWCVGLAIVLIFHLTKKYQP